MRKFGVLVVAMALMAAACGNEAAPVGSGDAAEERTGTSGSPTTMSESPNGSERPPDLRVIGGGTELVLTPSSYCWFVDGQGVCADGVPQEPLPTIALDGTSELSVSFPLDWQLSATLLAGGEYCNGATVIDADPGGSPLETLGPANTYRVDVFGRGQNGDAAWAFELVTSEDRPLPPPYVQAFWFPSGRDLESDARFHTLVGNIASPPTQIAATATVTAFNGESEEFELSVGDDGGCWVSSIGFEGSAQFTARVLDLGPPPYAAIVTVTVDGRTITGTPVSWPDDFPPNSNESRRVEAASESDSEVFESVCEDGPIPCNDEILGPTLAVGETLRYNMFVGCGEPIHTNDTWWVVTERFFTHPDYPPNWPVRVVNGAPVDGPDAIINATITLVDPSHIEIRLNDDTLVAIYEPSEAPPLLCG